MRSLVLFIYQSVKINKIRSIRTTAFRILSPLDCGAMGSSFADLPPLPFCGVTLFLVLAITDLNDLSKLQNETRNAKYRRLPRFAVTKVLPHGHVISAIHVICSA